MTERFETLAELLEHRAAGDVAQTGYTFATNGVEESDFASFRGLHEGALQIAALLQTLAPPPGGRALLVYEPGLDFLKAFFGCLYAGVVAVPVATPAPPRLDQGARTLRNIAADCTPFVVLCSELVRSVVGSVLDDPEEIASHGWSSTNRPGGLPAPVDDPHHGSPHDIALLQYTSGSTSGPRAVMLSQANLLVNLDAARGATRLTRDSCLVSWLPHFHDMGLSGMLQALHAGCPMTVMSPLSFLEDPLGWLRGVTKYRGTLSGAPNFAYDLCTRRARPETIAELDLSSWRVTANGAEPIRADTIRRFVETFGPAGFRPEAMMPCYGLAESVAFVTGKRRREPVSSTTFAAAQLRDGRAIVATDDGPGTVELVGCGEPADGHDVVIVNPDTKDRCPDGVLGEIWVRGPSVARGYWGKPDATRETFSARLSDGAGPYLRTGDIGFLFGDELFVAGRIKDLIIVGGENHYPQDIEATVERAHAGVRAGSVAAFALEAERELLVVVAEIRPAITPTAEAIEAIRRSVSTAHGLTVDGVALVAPHTVPKTSSGKIRRRACREAWSANRLDPVAHWESARLENARAPVAQPAEQDDVPVPGHDLGREIRTLVARVMGSDDAGALDPLAPLNNLGLGSLEAAELKRALDEELRIEVPLSRLLQGWTIADIERLGAGRSERRTNGASATTSDYERFVNPRIGSLLRSLGLDKTYVEGRGNHLYDLEGIEYLDLVAGYGAVPFGHNPTRIWAAIADVRDRAEPALVQPSALAAAGALGRRLIEVAPPGMTHVTFANSGAEAIEAAIKLARSSTGRPTIVSTVDGFHGKTLGALSATGSPDYQRSFGAPVPHFEHVPFGDLDALDRRLDDGADVAGFLVEPIQGEGGVVEPPAGYLSAAADLCRARGALLIIDEVQTGLGRTGTMFACESEGVSPDILAVGKALGGGLLPISAVVSGDRCASRDFFERHSSTFAGNTLACRAGLATLDWLVDDDRVLLDEVRARGAELRLRLDRLKQRYPSVVRSARGRGFLLGLELTGDRDAFPAGSLLGVAAQQGRLGALAVSYLLNVRRVRVAPTLLGSNVLRLEPSLVFETGLVPDVVDALEEVVRLIAGDGTDELLQHLCGTPRSAGAPVVDRPKPRRSGRPSAPSLGTRPISWAFLVHPTDLASYRTLDRSLHGFDDLQLGELHDRLSRVLEPFAVAGAEIVSARGARSYGEFVAVPRLPSELREVDRLDVTAEIEGAIEDLSARGARVVGLGGYLSIATGGGIDLRSPHAFLTSGNALTALAGLQTVMEALASLEIDPEAASVAIVGAAGSVGSNLAHLLAGRVGTLMLVGNPARRAANVARLERLRHDLETSRSRVRHVPELSGVMRVEVPSDAGDEQSPGASRILVSTEAEAILPRADVVITATSSYTSIVDSSHLKAGAVVCDISRPSNVDPSVLERDDVVVIEAGFLDVPGCEWTGADLGLPAGQALACMCETMLLGLDPSLAVPPAVGSDSEVVAALERAAAEHGFTLAPLRSPKGPISSSEWAVSTREDWDAAHTGMVLNR